MSDLSLFGWTRPGAGSLRPRVAHALPMQVSAATDDILGDMDAVAIAQRIGTGEIGAVEVLRAAIARLEAVNPELNAIVCERFEAALREAHAPPSQHRPALFAGLPILIKDNVDVAGLPTRYGSRGTPKSPSPRDGEITRQIRATGFIPIAKTTLPEFGLTATTEFNRDAPTRNPWNTAYSSGGSSGGSAALVAAGAVPLAHANDGGGSIRIPASCCGLVGLKPSRNRLRTGELAGMVPINVITEGVITRSVRDTAAFYAQAEQHYLAPGLAPMGHVTGPGAKRLRIGISTWHPGPGRCDPEVVALVHNVANRCAALGHCVDETPPLISDQVLDDFFLYWARLATTLRYLGRFALGPGFDRRQTEPLTRYLSRHFFSNFWRAPAVVSRLRRHAYGYQSLFARYDLILTPTLASPPPALGHLAPDLDFDTAVERLRYYAPFTPSQNVSGTPAISLPLGQSAAGLPIGVQFAAAMGQERSLLEIAYALEQAMPWSYPAGADHPADPPRCHRPD